MSPTLAIRFNNDLWGKTSCGLQSHQVTNLASDRPQVWPGLCTPSLLRGLLVLVLTKPTRITSIELELSAKSSTSWPEGFGARRLEITEEHTVFRASAVYFRAEQDPQRRTASVGPGISFHDGYDDWDDHPHTPEPLPTRRHRPGSIDNYVHRPHLDHYDEHYSRAPPYSSSPATPVLTSRATSPASSVFHLPLSPSSETHTSPVSDSRRSKSILPNVPEPTTGLLREQLTSPQNELFDETDHHAETTPNTPDRPRDGSYEGQDRSRSRFSFASMSNAFLDVVRSRHGADDSQSLESRGRSRRIDTSNDVGTPPLRGRPLEKAIKDHTRKPFRMLGNFLKHDDHEEPKKSGLDWKEFKKGTYTYPISLSIPSNAPPTLQCDHGNVTWRLKAVVHRPGAFESKLIATREVIVVASPSDDDTENTENIVVERHWDQQLQYLISISGRSFYIGGTIPISFTLMPLAEVKIHKVHVCIEERVDYYTQLKRISRTEPMRRIVLLDVKSEARDHILPLKSDDVGAFRNSPFYHFATPADDLSKMASSLMGPGPWTFHQDLRLPHSCRYIHFTNRNKLSGITITHTLKWTIRVERGDDLHVSTKTGKRKLFDIVMQTPVHILSCRCNPEWIALPSYSERLTEPHTITPNCPCYFNQMSPGMFRGPTALERVTSEGSASSASSVEASAINSATMPSLRQEVPTLLQMTSQYERLISGQETETGETPPAYVA